MELLKKYNKIILGSVIVSRLLVLGFFVGSIILQNSTTTSLKLSYAAANVDQLADDPVIEQNKEYLLFLDQYVGPVVKNAYVIKGLYQGQYKIIDKQINVNDKIKENHKSLADSIKSKNNLLDYLENKLNKN